MELVRLKGGSETPRAVPWARWETNDRLRRHVLDPAGRINVHTGRRHARRRTGRQRRIPEVDAAEGLILIEGDMNLFQEVQGPTSRRSLEWGGENRTHVRKEAGRQGSLWAALRKAKLRPPGRRRRGPESGASENETGRTKLRTRPDDAPRLHRGFSLLVLPTADAATSSAPPVGLGRGVRMGLYPPSSPFMSASAPM